MSDFGFNDEARHRRGRTSHPFDFGQPGLLTDESPARRSPIALLFTLLAVALVVFAAWAYSGRIHADDQTAFVVLNNHVVEFERAFDPLGQGKRPPCGITDEGWLEKTWPSGSDVTIGSLEAYAIRLGWVPDSPAATTGQRRTFTRHWNDRLLTLRLDPPQGDRGPVLTATSQASAFGCLFR